MNILICCVAVAFGEVPATGAAQPLQVQLRRLEKEISAARGLAFKSPVAAKAIARPKGVAPGAQGYYSTTDKTLFVYDDIKDNYREGVLIHEMVHALQVSISTCTNSRRKPRAAMLNSHWKRSSKATPHTP